MGLFWILLTLECCDGYSSVTSWLGYPVPRCLDNSFFFLFGCAGSLLLYVWAFSSCSSGACSLVVVHRLPLWWLLLLWTWALGHASFRSLQLMGLAALPHMESSLTGNWTCVPCIGRRILNLWITREVLFFSAMLHGLWDFSSPAKEWTQALGSENVES